MMHTNLTHAGRRRGATFVLIAAAAVAGAGPASAGVAPEVTTVSAISVTPSEARIEHLEQQLQEAEPATLSPRGGPVGDPADPSSVPLTAPAVLGGGLVAAAAGVSIYRFRHQANTGPSIA
jgi:hypothetical protein